MATENNIDLVPAEVLEQVRQLDSELKETIKTSGSFLATASQINKILSNQAASYKDVTAAVAEYNKMEADIIATQKKQQDIIKNMASLQEEVIKKNTVQVTSTKNLEKSIEEANKAFSALSPTIQQLTQRLTEMDAEQKKTRASLSELDKLYKSGTITIAEYTEKKSALKTLENEQKKSVKDLTNEIKLNIQAVNTQEGSYDNLSAKYRLLKMEINSLGEAEGENAQRKRELEKEADNLYSSMQKLQEATGRHVLSVGNYSLATKDLVQAGSLISPTLTTATLAVTSFGKSLLKLLANPIVATIAAIVGVVTAFVAVFTKAMNVARSNEEQFAKLEQAMAPIRVIADGITRTFEGLADTFINVTSTIGGLITRFTDFVGITDGLTEATNKYMQLEKDRLKLAQDSRSFSEEAAKAEIETSELRAQVADKENLTAEERLALLNRIEEVETNLAEERKRIAEENLRILEEEGERTKNSAEFEERLSEARINVYNATSSLNDVKRNLNRLRQTSIREINAEAEAEAKKSKEALDNERKATNDLVVFRLQKNADLNRELLNDSNVSFQNRINALNTYISQEAAIIKRNADFQLSNSQLTATQRQLIIEKMNAELDKLEESRYKSATNLAKQAAAEQVRILEESYRNASSVIDASGDIEFSDLSALYASGQIDREKYEEEKTEITRRYARLRFEEEIKLLESTLEAYNVGSEEHKAITQKINDARLSYDREINRQIIADNEKAAREIEKNEEDSAKKREQIERKIAATRKQLIQEVGNFASQIISNVFQGQIKSLENQLSEVKKFYDERNELIDEQENAGLITSEYAAAQRKYLNEEQARQEEELEEKKKEILLRQAKFEKAQAILSSGINTALAITKQLAVTPLPLGAPLIATISAIGAAQLATILATPLPQYKHGTDNHPGGLALVGDGGRSEMAIFPDGSIYKTPSIPTVVSMPSGTEVLPDFNTAALNFLVPRKKENAPVIIQENKKQIRLLEENNKMTGKLLMIQNKDRANNIYNRSKGNLYTNNKIFN